MIAAGLLLNKLGIPLLCVVTGIAAGMGIMKKLEKPVTIPQYECPDCNCPAAQSALDIEKLKGFKNAKIDLNVSQHYHVNIDGDSLVMAQFRKAVKDELTTLKVSRCK